MTPRLKMIHGILLVMLTSHTFAQTIVLDVGHTPTKSGALGVNGKTEYSYNLNMVNALKKALQQNTDIQVKTTSVNEPDIQLAERSTRFAKSDLFVSIHHDSIPEVLYPKREELKGFSIFVSQKNPQYAKSLACAKIVAKNLKAIGRSPSTYHGWDIEGERKTLLHVDGVYQYDNLVVLKSATMPALLIEIGVIANPQEAEQLTQPNVVDQIAHTIAHALNACVNM